MQAAATEINDAGGAEEAPEADAEAVYRDDMVPLLTSLPGLIPGTDPVKHESEIVFLVETARNDFGVRTPEDLAAWVSRIQLLAMRSGMVDATGRSPTVQEPPIRTLTRYMEERARMLQATHSA